MTDSRSAICQRESRKIEQYFRKQASANAAGPSRLPALASKYNTRKPLGSAQNAIVVDDSDEEEAVHQKKKARTKMSAAESSEEEEAVEDGRGGTPLQSWETLFGETSRSSTPVERRRNLTSAPQKLPSTQTRTVKTEHRPPRTPPTTARHARPGRSERKAPLISSQRKLTSSSNSASVSLASYKGNGTDYDPLEILSDTSNASVGPSVQRDDPNNPFLNSPNIVKTPRRSLPSSKLERTPSNLLSQTSTPLARIRNGVFGSHAKRKETPPASVEGHKDIRSATQTPAAGTPGPRTNTSAIDTAKLKERLLRTAERSMSSNPSIAMRRTVSAQSLAKSSTSRSDSPLKSVQRAEASAIRNKSPNPGRSTFKPAPPPKKATESNLNRAVTSKALAQDDESFRVAVKPRRRDSTTPSVDSRPKRARPSVGSYTVPSMDDPIHKWAATPQSRGNYPEQMWKRSLKKSSTANGQIESQTDQAEIQLTPKSAPVRRTVSQQSIHLSRTPGSSQKARALPGEHLVDLGSSQVDEEVEDVEDVEGEIVHDGAMEVDLLAQFEDFQFEAPASPIASKSAILPTTPTRARAAYSPSNRQHSSSRHSVHASPLSAVKRTPHAARTPHCSQLNLVSPARSSQRPPGPASRTPNKATATSAKKNVVASLLADQAASRAAARAAAEKLREQRRKQIAALEREDETDEESEAEEENLGGMDDIFSAAHAHEPDHAGFSHRRHTRSQGILASPQKPKRHHIPYRPVPNAEIEKMARANRKDMRKGMSNADAERLLADIHRLRGESLEKDVPYPTPASFPDEEEEVSRTQGDLDGDKLESALRALPEGAVDAGILRAVKSEKSKVAKEEDSEAWEGFWEDGEMYERISEDRPDPTVHFSNSPRLSHVRKIVEDLLDKRDMVSLSTLVSSGVLSIFLKESQNANTLAQWLLAVVFNTPMTSTQGETASRILQSLIGTITLDLLAESPAYLAFALHVWQQVGIRQDLAGLETSMVLSTDFKVGINRIEASMIICSLTRGMTNAGNLRAPEAERLATYLLLLHADTGTSHVLRRNIDITLLALWEVVSETKHALLVAKNIVEATSDLPLSVQSKILVAVGTDTSASRNISRWLAAGYLLAQQTSELDLNDVIYHGPPFNVIFDAAEMIFEEVGSGDPDHEAIFHWINFLWEAMSDIPSLVDEVVEELGEAANDELEQLRACLRITHGKIQVKSFSDSKDYLNKSRLSQIHVNTEYLIKTALVRRKRKEREKMKDVSEGEAGQMKLAFALKGKGSTQS